MLRVFRHFEPEGPRRTRESAVSSKHRRGPLPLEVDSAIARLLSLESVGPSLSE